MKVECIYNFTPRLSVETVPIKGQIYTVREYVTFGSGGYRLVEIHNPKVQYHEAYDECSFARHGFRPITDISALQSLTKVRELEDA